MRLRIPIACIVASVLLAGSAPAQSSAAPVLASPANIQYPPIAKAAHVHGDVIVDFSIDADGSTRSVDVISGQPMLTTAVEGNIRGWKFQTPLPLNAQRDFEATYKFSFVEEADSIDDDLDSPPPLHCCSGDDIVVSPGLVKGEVRSRDGSQTINVTPGPPPDRCPADSERYPPAHTRPDDYVELRRTSCTVSCLDYRVRVYRNGQIEWHGSDRVSLLGDAVAQLQPAEAEALLRKFQTATYWHTCSAQPPAHDQDSNDEGFVHDDFLTADIDGHMKSVIVEDAVIRTLAWTVDKAANTHRWRHGDSFNEPYTNMLEDLTLPKPGITKLIRATYRFSSVNGQQSVEALKHLLAEGVDVDGADESGWTPLMYAAHFDSYENSAGRLLLDAHANVNRASMHGDTALMIAAYGGTLNELLLRAGADINAHNADGVTALMLFAQ